MFINYLYLLLFTEMIMRNYCTVYKNLGLKYTGALFTSVNIPDIK